MAVHSKLYLFFAVATFAQYSGDNEGSGNDIETGDKLQSALPKEPVEYESEYYTGYEEPDTLSENYENYQMQHDFIPVVSLDEEESVEDSGNNYRSDFQYLTNDGEVSRPTWDQIPPDVLAVTYGKTEKLGQVSITEHLVADEEWRSADNARIAAETAAHVAWAAVHRTEEINHSERQRIRIKAELEAQELLDAALATQAAKVAAEHIVNMKPHYEEQQLRKLAELQRMENELETRQIDVQAAADAQAIINSENQKAKFVHMKKVIERINHEREEHQRLEAERKAATTVQLQKEETRHNQRILNHFNVDAEHQRRRKNIFAK